MMFTPGQVRDADVARRVRSALHEQFGYVADGLEIDVHDGIVALAGDVESGNQKTVAEKIVDGLAGVGAVVHFLWLVKADLREPLIYASILAALLATRIPWRRFTR